MNIVRIFNSEDIFPLKISDEIIFKKGGITYKVFKKKG